MAKCPQTQCQVSQAAEGNVQAQCEKTLLPEMVKKKKNEGNKNKKRLLKLARCSYSRNGAM